MATTIMITGASAGIGNVTALLAQEAGWNVVATMRNPDLEHLAHFIDAKNTLVTHLDVTDLESITTAVSEADARFGGIDVLVNNAAYGAFGPLEPSSLDRIRKQFETNVIGLLAVTQAVIPQMRQRRSGTIINVSSIGGQVGFPLGSLYHGSKFAVEGISESLFYELAEIGVRMKIVEPGFVDTEFASSVDFHSDPELTEYDRLIENRGLSAKLTDHPRNKPDAIAKVILRAAEDSSCKLRYRAGADSEELLTRRKMMSDAEFIADMRHRVGLR